MIFDPGARLWFLEIVNLYFLADEYEAAKLRWAGGAQRPVWRGNEPKKTGAHARPKPTSINHIFT